MQTDFAAHPFLGIIAAAVLDEYRFARAKDVTVAKPDRAQAAPRKEASQ